MKTEIKSNRVMDYKTYAFYRTGNAVVLESGERIPFIHWPSRLARIFAEGNDVWQLHLDIPVEFNLIRTCFFSPDYWRGRTWQQEYNAE